jgi:hypothetical protein
MISHGVHLAGLFFIWFPDIASSQWSKKQLEFLKPPSGKETAGYYCEMINFKG